MATASNPISSSTPGKASRPGFRIFETMFMTAAL